MGRFVTRTSVVSGGGGGDEAFGSYAAMDLEAEPIYRIDMSETYPTWIDDELGATLTHEATGAWDGGPCAKITPITSGEGYNALGGFLLDKGGTFAIRKLNCRYEVYFGSTYSTYVEQPKWCIVHSSPTLGGGTDERPMYYWGEMNTSGGSFTGQNCMAFASACGTLKQYSAVPSAPLSWSQAGADQAFLASADGTVNSLPKYNASQWFTVEHHCVAVSTGSFPNGIIRGRITKRDGTVVATNYCEWTWDSNWSLGDYFSEWQVLGGYQAPATADANNFFRIAGVTFAVGQDDFIGPRVGFLT